MRLATKKLLILDIDECLVHATETPRSHSCDFSSEWCYVYKRPFIDEFIEFCGEHFDVALWTTAGHLHAELIVQNLFSKDFNFEFIWSARQCTRRYDCLEFREYWIKNFRKLRLVGYDLSQVIMVDDSPEKHIRNYGNLVEVSPFHGERDDRELRLSMRYLLKIKDVENIRAMEKRFWRNEVIQDE